MSPIWTPFQSSVFLSSGRPPLGATKMLGHAGLLFNLFAPHVAHACRTSANKSFQPTNSCRKSHGCKRSRCLSQNVRPLVSSKSSEDENNGSESCQHSELLDFFNHCGMLFRVLRSKILIYFHMYIYICIHIIVYIYIYV